MSDLIDRQAAIDAVCGECQGSCIPCDSYPCGEIDAINDLSSAEPEERTAKVEHVDMKNVNAHVYKCLECGQYFHLTSWHRYVKYCSNCGAKLDWSDYARSD